MALLDDAQFESYKKKVIPVVFDWLVYHRLQFPTQACRWGPKISDDGQRAKYRAYLSEQILDGSQPNTLLLANVDVTRPHHTSVDSLTNWTERSTSDCVTIIKTIYHPGEVNKIRELPQYPNVVVTHTDSSSLYVWSTDRQPDRRPAGSAPQAGSSKSRKSSGASSHGSTPSVPDLELTGHTDDAAFPLATSAVAPWVASGGDDKLVLLWDLSDNVAGLTSSDGGKKQATELANHVKLEGHTDVIGDVVFAPASCHVLASVSDDGCVMTWDTREKRRAKGSKDGLAAVAVLPDAHGAGVNVMCVDWCALDDNMIVTGAQDGSIIVWDKRRMASAADAVLNVGHHRGGDGDKGVIHVEWHPNDKRIFASGSEDHTVMIWNMHPDVVDYATGQLLQEAGAGGGGAEAGGGGDAADADGEGKGGAGPSGDEGASRKRTRGGAGKGAKGGKEGEDKGEGELFIKEPSELIFKHIGHRFGKVTDFQWNPSEAWTLISVSANDTDDVQDGTLQLWRINDLIYRPYAEALKELEGHSDFVLSGEVQAASIAATSEANRGK